MKRKKTFDPDNPPLTRDFIMGMRPIAETDPEFAAHLKKKMGRPLKDQRYTKATISFPPDILEWLKAPGPGYQTRLHNLLRAIMETSGA